MADVSAPARLSIRVLGELEVSRGAAALPLPPSRKTRALLAYLVLTEREHRRDRLCSLLWDVTDDPRGALRWSVSKLRPLCDEPEVRRIVADRDVLRFVPHGAWIDLLEVRERTLGDALGRCPFEELAELEREFRGELLAGLALEDFDEFQSWCVAQREQARVLHASILQALVQRSPTPERALPYARALVGVDALNQAARAALVDLLGQLGLLEEIDQQYQAGRRLLAELAIGGGVELEQAYSRARRVAIERAARAVLPEVRSAPAGEVTAPPDSVSPGEIPFVGRARERAELSSLLVAAERGRARVVLLSGQPGAGKSRLARELLTAARQRRASVLAAQSYEVESGRPYGPWIDALRQIPRSAVGGRLADELAVLVPEWGPQRSVSQTEEQLFGAVSELIAARAHSAPPVVIAFDDIHWLDEPSSRLLHYVARLHRHRPLLVVLTARDGELPDNAAALRTLRSLRRDGSLHEIEVGPLGADDIRRIANHLSTAADGARIYAESGGNPLFAIELARALPGGSAQHGISSTLSALILDRVRTLPDAAREALRWASVLGSSFAVERLEMATGMNPDEVASALELLARHALLQQAAAPGSARGAGDCAFAHEIVRRAVYAEMSEPRRRLMHRRVAEALEPMLERDEALAADVVHHATVAGRPEVSARACLRAAQRCVKLFASREAEVLVRRGFYHAQHVPAPERVKLELELWRVRLEAERPAESDTAAREIERLAGLALDQGESPSARLAFHLLSWLRWEQGASEDAKAFSLRAEELSRDLSELERVAALAESARCLMLVESDLASAEALALEAEARAERSGVTPMAVPDALGMLEWHRGELARAAELFATARSIARRGADRTSEFQALEHQFCALLEAGEEDAARAVGRELAELGEKLRGGSEAPLSGVLSALLDYLRDPCAAERALDGALAGLRATDAKQRLCYAQSAAAQADLAHQRPGRAAERAEEALGAANALCRLSDVALARVLVLRAARSLGDEERASVQLEALMALPLAKVSARARQALDTVTGRKSERGARTERTRSDGSRRRRTRVG